MFDRYKYQSVLEQLEAEALWLARVGAKDSLDDLSTEIVALHRKLETLKEALKMGVRP